VEIQAGAVSHKQIDWTTIDWRAVNQNVRRLQARIVKATQAEAVKPRSEKSVGKA
jgi:RNA-directed DNA polymerase